MKGYYAIYNHQKNAWWTQGNWWMNDTPYESHNIPTKYELKKGWGIDGDPQMDLRGDNYKDVLIYNRTIEKNPYNIFVFETLKEAEDYLLNGGVYKEHNDYFTIRKIYF